ncbi:hypothetical protein HC928_00230 [bacterium]|nr:hypothetical protein [bacterium]
MRDNLQHFDMYMELVTKAWREHGVLIEQKSSRWYWRFLGFLLRIVSFGKIDFMNDFQTVIGNRIGVTPSWKHFDYAMKYATLLHELEHIKEYKKFGFGNVWVGVVVFGFLYLFFPLPVGLAWFRARAEKAGYEQSLRAYMRTHGYDAAAQAKDHVIKQFTSANYLWMWPFPKQLSKWFDSALVRIAEEEGIDLQ